MPPHVQIRYQQFDVLYESSMLTQIIAGDTTQLTPPSARQFRNHAEQLFIFVVKVSIYSRRGADIFLDKFRSPDPSTYSRPYLGDT